MISDEVLSETPLLFCLIHPSSKHTHMRRGMNESPRQASIVTTHKDHCHHKNTMLAVEPMDEKKKKEMTHGNWERRGDAMVDTQIAPFLFSHTIARNWNNAKRDLYLCCLFFRQWTATPIIPPIIIKSIVTAPVNSIALVMPVRAFRNWCESRWFLAACKVTVCRFECNLTSINGSMEVSCEGMMPACVVERMKSE